MPLFSSSPSNCAVGADPAMIAVTGLGTLRASGALTSDIWTVGAPQ